MIWDWQDFLRPAQPGDITLAEACHKPIMLAFARIHLIESRRQDMRQVWELLATGWKFEIPQVDCEPMALYWRAPAKRVGGMGRKYLSTNQAWGAMRRAAA